MSDALDYHRATNVAAGGTDEDEVRTAETKPSVFKDYGDAERVSLAMVKAAPVLQGASVVRSQDNRDYGGGTIHWRAYSSAGALFPVEVYVAAATGLFAFDPLAHNLVRIGGDVRKELGIAAYETLVPDRHPRAHGLEVHGARLPPCVVGRGHDAREPPRARVRRGSRAAALHGLRRRRRQRAARDRR